MENFKLASDIKVYCIKAKSFPQGVLEAHQKLHSLIPYTLERKYFGISRPEVESQGKIVYSAAADELVAGDLSKYNLEEFIIPKGNYISIIAHNYMDNLPAIGKAFDKLTAFSEIDPQGYCIEMYLNDKEVRCMIRLNKSWCLLVFWICKS